MQYIKEEDGRIYAECPECGQVMKFKKSGLYIDKNLKIYKLPEKVECFCEEESDIIHNVPVTDNTPQIRYVEKPSTTISTPKNVPKCPTCGSVKVTKISLGSKAVGGAMFGIFSSNIRNSYKCNNCGYKW